MASNFRVLSALATILFLVSCETPLDIGDLNHKPMAVFLSHLTPDTHIEVQLFTDRSVLDPEYFSFEGIGDATIRLYEDGEFVDVLSPVVGDLGIAAGIYEINYHPIENRSYSFEVEHQQVPSIKVSDKVPLKTSSLTLQALNQSYKERTNGAFKGDIEFAMEFEDLSSERSYYELSFDHFFYYRSQIPELGDTIRLSTELFPAIAQTDIFEDNIDKWLTTNELFEESKYLVRIQGELNVPFWAVEGLVSHGITVTLRQVSEAYYQYYLTAELQRYLSGDPFADPVQVFSNVEGGSGILGSFVSDTLTIELSHPE